MNTKSIIFSVLFAATAFVFLQNCSGNQKEDSGTSEHADHSAEDAAGEKAKPEPPADAVDPQFSVSDAFQKQLADVFASYVSLKDALVASDPEKVKEEAGNTQSSLAQVDMKLVSGAAHNDWMNFHAPMKESLSNIASTSDIEAQRKSFSTLSDNLHKSIKAFGLGGTEAYYQYCPMAFNNDGAYWISEEQQIRNPYFGKKMLTCGEVKEKLN